MEQKIHNTIIVGSGPSGYTAAIYTARANMSPLLFTGVEPGGQLMITTDVENYPGYPNGVLGPQMMDDFMKQAQRFGTDIKYEVIEKVDLSGPVHKLWTESGELFLAHTVIISTGASAKWLGLESEKRLMNKGVSACAVCDGFFFKGKVVSVVGGGDTAVEEATYLSKMCPEVHLFVRRDVLRASKIMQERLMANPVIRVHWNTEIEEIGGEHEVTHVNVIDRKTGNKQRINLSAVFIAIGHQPNSTPFRQWLDTDEQGYIKTIAGSTKTRIEGVFACGDVQDRIYRQAITAAGSGCMAALDAERFLVEKGLH
ncbi:MAG: thioredoxin-disulfide reductase [Saprospiraceae bacterium]|nr:thioredoxin-disulfide reductase [Saprospiraceae bacterium]MBV6471864.1 Thioredoxin reductase [Saprospiraceae bacterium]